MEITIYNGLTKTKEVFSPLYGQKTTFYSCGPTTYDFLHVGNARALVVGDLIYRILKSFGHRVVFVRNFTDVDDKIIERAKKLGRGPLELASKYVEECQADMNSLGLLPPTHAPKVSETIPEIIQMIQDIIEKGHGYVVKGEVLFHVPSFPSYGKLSGRDLEGLKHGSRVKTEDHKKHPSDFVLWKPAKKGEPAWDSPWGPGRPGWHIECSTMSCKFLGKHFDLHHGGVDLIFPHHENEIAQSEAANASPFCHTWVHNEFVNFNREKMSKSLGNIILIRKFIQSYNGPILRQLLSSVHYRSRLEWSGEAIDKAIDDTEKIHLFAKNIENSKEGNKKGNLNKIESSFEKIKQALADDFHIPKMLSFLFPLIRDFNKDFLLPGANPDEETLQILKKLLSFVKNSTGLIFDHPENVVQDIELVRKRNHKGHSLDVKEIEDLICEREKARRQKDWPRADDIRKKLHKNGISIKDHPDGTHTWSYS